MFVIYFYIYPSIYLSIFYLHTIFFALFMSLPRHIKDDGYNDNELTQCGIISSFKKTMTTTGYVENDLNDENNTDNLNCRVMLKLPPFFFCSNEYHSISALALVSKPRDSHSDPQCHFYSLRSCGCIQPH